MRTLMLNGLISGGEAREPILRNMEEEGKSREEEYKGGKTGRAVERKASMCGGLHRVQEPSLPMLDLREQYETSRTLHEGCYARILLARHRSTATDVVLKAVYEELTPLTEFSREYHYSYRLSPHPAVLDYYDVTFRAEGCLVFAQEYAPLGDLGAHIRPGGLPAAACARIVSQIASALDFMHSKDLVHRDVRPENVLVFTADFSKVKLSDFRATRREGALVGRPRCTWTPLLPPEIHETVKNEKYGCKRSSDTWQLAVMAFFCLTGRPPWQAADAIADPQYTAWRRYQKRRTARVPPSFERFTPRALRMFRRLLEHEPDKRAPVSEVLKYSKDEWLEAKIRTSNSCSRIGADPSSQERKDSFKLYLRNPDGSRHSQENNKNKLNKLINSYGLDTTIDQKAITQRVWEWVKSCDVNADPTEVI